MPDAVKLLDLAGAMLRARNGDQRARASLLRDTLPLVADLVRPGSGRVVKRSIELLREAAGEDLALEDGGGGHRGDQLADYQPFIRRLLASPYGFYVIAGEPATGKTTLALRLAQLLADEHRMQILSVPGLHPDDRREWNTDGWVRAEDPLRFLKAMAAVQKSLSEGRDYPAGIMRRVLLLDDAALVAHTGAARFNRALLGVWSVYRHLQWVVIVTARSFKGVATVAENADARFLKRPAWQALTAERSQAIEWWREADEAFRALRQTDDWAERPRDREWVYVQAPRLRYAGMLPYNPPEPSVDLDAPEPSVDLDAPELVGED